MEHYSSFSTKRWEEGNGSDGIPRGGGGGGSLKAEGGRLRSEELSGKRETERGSQKGNCQREKEVGGKTWTRGVGNEGRWWWVRKTTSKQKESQRRGVFSSGTAKNVPGVW